MFSARLGFMRPDSVPDGDGGVPDEITTGNILFEVRAEPNKYVFMDTRNQHGTNPLATQFNTMAENWILTTFTISGRNNTATGVSRLNGLPIDTGLKFSSGQAQFSKFVWASWEKYTLSSSGRQGVPHVATDIFYTNTELGVSDLEKLEGYITHNSGLKSILASDHPYKSSAPANFTPDDLNPRAWFTASQGFDDSLHTWQSTNGNHVLKSTNRGITSGAPEIAFSDTVDGAQVIRFPNSKTDIEDLAFTGCKYECDSMLGSNNNTTGITFMYLHKFYTIPGVWDENTGPGEGNWANLFGFNNTDDNNYLFNICFPNTDNSTFNLEDNLAKIANASVDTGNVTTDGGNVSVQSHNPNYVNHGLCYRSII